MRSIKTAVRLFIKEPRTFKIAMWQTFSPVLPEKLYLKVLFKLKMGYKLDLESPRTFAEKCQWLKLFDRKPIYHQMVDKYEAKKLVASIIGEDYIIPTYGIWNKVEDIHWDSLPDKFVIKPTHSGGSSAVLICRDKCSFDIEKAKKVLRKAMNESIYPKLMEWTYKDVPPRIIAEQLLEDERTVQPRDYKFMCFNGQPKLFYITTGREFPGAHVEDHFFNSDGSYNSTIKHIHYESHPENQPAVPNNLSLMLVLAEKLSKGMPHLRVDLYEANDKVYFGELTFAEESGFASYSPQKWNKQFGDWISLPNKTV